MAFEVFTELVGDWTEDLLDFEVDPGIEWEPGEIIAESLEDLLEKIAWLEELEIEVVIVSISVCAVTGAVVAVVSARARGGKWQPTQH